MKAFLLAGMLLLGMVLLIFGIVYIIAPDKMQSWQENFESSRNQTMTKPPTDPGNSEIPWFEEPKDTPTPTPKSNGENTPGLGSDLIVQISTRDATIADLTKRNDDLLKAIRQKEDAIVEQEQALEKASTEVNKVKVALENQTKQITDLKTTLAKSNGSSSFSAIPEPKITRAMSQTEVMELLRATFPNARIRGPEREKYSLVNFTEVQRFLKTDAGSELDLGEDSDYVINLMGAFKQPNWSTVPVGYVKKTTSHPVFPIVIAEESGKAKIYAIDILEDEILPVETDKSIEFIAALF
ncbi:MAG: hypothetical protein PHW72_01100 [Candidatus Pacebacteria bacterium]|nr:hypothetical protein [Candidatus Paceibacterota bacterium]